MSRALPDAGYFERIPIQDPLGEDVEDIPAVDRYRFACRHVRGLRVLDIACGTGYGSVLLREVGGAEHVLGVDLAEEALAEARRFASPGRIEFAQGSAERIPLGDGSVDAVVALETIEHVGDPEQFLGEIRRVLRPEGVCIVSTPLNETESRFRPPNPFHVREYTQAEFRELLGRHFEGVELWFQVSNFRDDPAWEAV